MKVKELIETLQIYNEDSEVLIINYDKWMKQDGDKIVPVNTINDIEPIVSLRPKDKTIILLVDKFKELS